MTEQVVLIAGGYGVVGKRIATELAPDYPGRIVIAGRNLARAERRRRSNRLKELELFFQPAVLDAVCKLANEYDHPKKRKYSYELMSITCKRERDKSTIIMPRNYSIPSKRPLETFKGVLAKSK